MRDMFALTAMTAIAAVALSGCAGNSDRPYPTWKGAPLNDLINAWGPPDRASTLPNGDRVVMYGEYIERRVPYMPWRRKNQYCEAEWWAGSDNVVKSFRWRGSAGICKRILDKRGYGPNQQKQYLLSKENVF
jgi:hypothetical protein